MAHFKTHVIGSALVSGVVATGMIMVSHEPVQMIAGYFMLGMVGGVLPDIDSGKAIPTRIAFALVAVVAALIAVFYFADRLSLVELILLGVFIYGLVHHAIFPLFSCLTHHRGMIHSIPAALFAGLLAVLIADRLFAAQAEIAWTTGAFVGMGFLVHLLLDEVCSVDMRGMKIKRSFGTALTLGSRSNAMGTACVYLGVVVLYLLCPPIQGFADSVADVRLHQALIERLWPSGPWFAGIWTLLY